MLHVRVEGAIATFVIDRPAAKNALDLATIAVLREAIEETPARVVILTGAGGTFVSGGDLRELRDKTSAEDAAMLRDAGHALTTAIARAPCPVIAILTGHTIGGGAELAIACDLRIGHPAASIAFKQVRMGVTTAWGGAERLASLVGGSRAARLLFTARAVGMDEAEAIGLVDGVAEDPNALAAELASEIVRGSATAIAETKAILRRGVAERDAFIRTWTGADHRDAVEAYFRGRVRS
jgi:enoyl-CoA hydratase